MLDSSLEFLEELELVKHLSLSMWPQHDSEPGLALTIFGTLYITAGFPQSEHSRKQEVETSDLLQPGTWHIIYAIG